MKELLPCNVKSSECEASRPKGDGPQLCYGIEFDMRFVFQQPRKFASDDLDSYLHIDVKRTGTAFKVAFLRA
jgi:hypothetical protein